MNDFRPPLSARSARLSRVLLLVFSGPLAAGAAFAVDGITDG